MYDRNFMEISMKIIAAAALACAFASGLANAGSPSVATVPAYAGPVAPIASSRATAVFAGGCFWGVDAVFKHVKGVVDVVSGYSGGSAATAKYPIVGTGTTGHAESVEVTYNPSQITYADLLQVFFGVAHDPTELDRQGPDYGTQYRSVVFYANDEQKTIAERYIAELDRAKVFPKPIVTEVSPLHGFYPAEAYHQNFLERHPDNPYIVYNDLPKLAKLKLDFPDRYRPL